MINRFFILAVLLFIFIGCKTSIQTVGDNHKESLKGVWELNYISKQNLQELYSYGMPFIKFDVEKNMVNGNNGCNLFGGKIEVSGNKISFNQPMTATKIYCPGLGEPVFMKNLFKIEKFSISKDGKTLQFIGGDIVLMCFIKKSE